MSTLMTPPAAPTETPAGTETPPPSATPTPTDGDGAPAAPPAAPTDGGTATPPPAPPAEPVVPETYQLTLAENSTLDASLLERASSLAKELQLTNEAAQRVVSAVESELAAQLEVIRAADAPLGELWKARVAQYESDALADPDLGAGNRAQLEKVAQRATLVAEKFGGKELLDFLGTTGAGSHPVFLKMFGVKLFKAFGEGEFVQPTAIPAADRRNPADVLYGGKSATAKE